MTPDVQRPRDALLLFGQQLELDVCAESLQGLTHARFHAERLGGNPREVRTRTHHLVGSEHPPAAVLFLGWAAWIDGQAPMPQDAIWARELRTEAGPTLRPSLRISSAELGSMPFVHHRLVTTLRPVLDSDRAGELAQLGAEMVDQWAYGVVEACVESEVECAVVLMARGWAGSARDPSDRSALEPSMRRLSQATAPLLQWLERRENRRLSRASG